MILLKDGQQIGETIDQKQLTQIVDAIAELDNLIVKITKKGLKWSEYLKFREEGKMPIFRVVDQNQVKYIYSDKEWKEFKAELAERKKQMQQENVELPVDGLTEEVLPEYKELWELPRINILADKLEKRGLHLRQKPIPVAVLKPGQNSRSRNDVTVMRIMTMMLIFQPSFSIYFGSRP